MGPKNYRIGIVILLMTATTSSIATKQVSSRQRGHSLIKFEGDQQQGQRQHGTINFQELENSQGNSDAQPFRFDEIQHFQGNSPEDHLKPQSNIEVDNSVTFGQANAFSYPEDDINGVKTSITFQDDNIINEQKGQKKRKKRRRRRPRLQQFPVSDGYPGGYPTPEFSYPTPESGSPTPWSGYATSGSGYPNPGAGYPTPESGYITPVTGYPIPGSVYPHPGFGYPNSGSRLPSHGSGYSTIYGQNHYGPLRRPSPQSVASDAIATVTRALASIARYDDYQCVPRLLCEAAGGGGAFGAGAPGTGTGSGLLNSVVALQPLLTLLSAYNGISASPLFIFGRAVFLGMTSRGAVGSPAAPATCRYAYPLCPTDPEQLVHYLNNHNGGFFRFFNAPQRPAHFQYGLQQSLEQFYNQLAAPDPNSGQYGFYKPAENIGGSPGQYGQLGYPAPNGSAQRYGLYKGVTNQQSDSNYQISASNDYQNYGANYPYSQHSYGLSKFGFKNNKSELTGVETHRIEKRIQNVKNDQFGEEIFSSNIVDRNKHSKWLFPNTNRYEDYPHRNHYSKRENKQLSFPKENFKSDYSNSNRKAKGFYFPGDQSNRDVDLYAYEETQHNNALVNNYGHDLKNEASQDEEGVEVVYIVRGDGDPRHPEVVKLRPVQTRQ